MESPSQPNRPTILHCITGLGPGGAERMLLRTLPSLSKFSHVVLCLQTKGIMGKKLEEMGFRVFYTPPWRAISSLRHLAREISPSLMITYLPAADLLGKIFGKYFGIPVIICSLRSTMRDWRYIPYLFLEGITACRANHYIAVSNAVKTRFVQFGIPAKKITVIPNGIPFMEIEFTAHNSEKSLMRAELHITPNTLVLGVLGGLRKERGHAHLFKAFAEAQSKLSMQSRLLIIGDGPERNDLLVLAHRLRIEGAVDFLGFRNDPFRVLTACDIGIISSFYEGMSNALLEMMAMGLPIIAADVPENKELLTDHDSGLLVPPKASAALCNAIVLLAQNCKLRAAMGESAAKRARLFSLDKTILKLEEFLNNTLHINKLQK